MQASHSHKIIKVFNSSTFCSKKMPNLVLLIVLSVFYLKNLQQHKTDRNMNTNPRFEIFPGLKGMYYFRLFSAKGDSIFASEGYNTAYNCRNGIAAVKANAQHDDRFRRKTAVNGQHYFVLVGANGEILGK